MTAPRRRLIANELCEEFHVSQRRVARALDLARSGLRYAPVVRDEQAALARRIEELAGAHPEPWRNLGNLGVGTLGSDQVSGYFSIGGYLESDGGDIENRK